MKNICFLILFAITFATITGCSASISMRGNTLKSKEFSPMAYATPTVAELDVADKKVIGSAKGRVEEKESLEHNAIADALKDVGDVLVGANFFYETNGDLMDILDVTVIGYPANYKNFRPAKSDELSGANSNRINFVIEGSGTISQKEIQNSSRSDLQNGGDK